MHGSLASDSVLVSLFVFEHETPEKYESHSDSDTNVP